MEKARIEAPILFSQGKRRCGVCKQVKELSEFHRHHGRTRGAGIASYQYRCKKCNLLGTINHRARILADPELAIVYKRHRNKWHKAYKIRKKNERVSMHEPKSETLVNSVSGDQRRVIAHSCNPWK